MIDPPRTTVAKDLAPRDAKEPRVLSNSPTATGK